MAGTFGAVAAGVVSAATTPGAATGEPYAVAAARRASMRVGFGARPVFIGVSLSNCDGAGYPPHHSAQRSRSIVERGIGGRGRQGLHGRIAKRLSVAKFPMVLCLIRAIAGLALR